LVCVLLLEGVVAPSLLLKRVTQPLVTPGNEVFFDAQQLAAQPNPCEADASPRKRLLGLRAQRRGMGQRGRTPRRLIGSVEVIAGLKKLDPIDGVQQGLDGGFHGVG